MRDITVLLTGCGAPGAPGVIKCLRNVEERNIRIIGADMSENAGGRSLVDQFYKIPAAKDRNFIKCVTEICLHESVEIIVPIVTRELSKFALAKECLQKQNISVMVMDETLLSIVNNKARLLSEMRAKGLSVAKFCTVHSLEDLIKACKDMGFPKKAICVKAAEGNGSRGIRIIDSNKSKYDLFFNEKPNSMYISYDELLNTLCEKPEIPEMLVMEYLPGVEYSVDYLATHGTIHYAVCRKALSMLTSNMTALEIEHNQAVIDLCDEVVEQFKLDGNFGFDVKFGADHKPYIIEINPRLTGGIVSAAACGVNLPYLGIKRLLGEDLPVCNINYGLKMARRYTEMFEDKDGKKIDW